MEEEEIIRPGYTRVTETLYPFSGLQNVDAGLLEFASDRGSKVHKTCEAIIKGFPSITDEETWGFVESFKLWWGTGRDDVYLEKRFYEDDLMVTGKCDLIIHSVEEGYTLVDFKTSSRPSKTWKIQGCAYAYMAKRSGVKVDNITFLHLNKHGKNPLEIKYDIDDDLFLSHMKIYNHYWGKK